MLAQTLRRAVQATALTSATIVGLGGCTAGGNNPDLREIAGVNDALVVENKNFTGTFFQDEKGRITSVKVHTDATKDVTAILSIQLPGRDMPQVSFKPEEISFGPTAHAHSFTVKPEINFAGGTFQVTKDTVVSVLLVSDTEVIQLNSNGVFNSGKAPRSPKQ